MCECPVCQRAWFILIVTTSIIKNHGSIDRKKIDEGYSWPVFSPKKSGWLPEIFPVKDVKQAAPMRVR